MIQRTLSGSQNTGFIVVVSPEFQIDERDDNFTQKKSQEILSLFFKDLFYIFVHACVCVFTRVLCEYL